MLKARDRTALGLGFGSGFGVLIVRIFSLATWMHWQHGSSHRSGMDAMVTWTHECSDHPAALMDVLIVPALIPGDMDVP